MIPFPVPEQPKMMDYLFYMWGAFMVGLTTRSAGIATLVCVIYHFFFYRAIFKDHFPSPWEFDIFYPLAFVLHGLLGWMVAWMLNTRSVFQVYPIEVLIRKPVEGDPTKYELVRKQFWSALFYRFVMGVLVCCMFTGATLPFEFIWIYKPSLNWLGFVLTFLALAISLALFYIFWAFAVPKSFAKKTWRRVMCPFRASGTKGLEYVTADDADLTLDVTMYIMIYYIVTWAFYIPMIILVPSFWAFWDVLIVFGALFIFYLIARITWVSSPGHKLAEAGKASECKTG